MASHVTRVLKATSILAILASVPAVALAQSGRAWVDPPSELGKKERSETNETSTPVVSSPAPQQTVSSPQQESPAKLTAPSTEMARTPSTSDVNEKTAESKAEPAQKATSSRSKASNRAASVRERPAKRRASKSVAARKENVSRRMADRQRRTTRSATVRDALNSGLEVMSLRTIEFPDGRRVEILVRPDPRRVSDLLNEPY